MEGQFTISSIIVIVWLIFPGVIFKRFYYKGQFAKQFGVGLFADRLITSIFWGIIVQIITFLLFSRYFGFTYTGIQKKVSEVYTNIAHNEMPNITYSNLIYILGYLAFLIIIAFALGSSIHFLIRYFKIDIKYPVFRFANHWNYYFRGEIIAMREFKSLKKGKWLSTVVDLVIDDGSEPKKMITGFLTQHTISQKTGELEIIYLTSAKRYSQTDKEFKPIPGDCLIVPFCKVIDLNLRYTFRVLTKVEKDLIKFNNITLFALTAGFLSIITLPWILKIKVYFKILGILTGCMTWLLLVMIATNPLQPISERKIDNKGIKSVAFAMVFFLILTVLLLGVSQIRTIFNI